MHFATQHEIESMLAQLHPRDPFYGRDYNLIVLAANTGLRVGELVALNHGDIWANGTMHTILWVRASISKSGRSREIPLNSVVRQALLALTDFNRRRGFSTSPDAPLFVTKHHRRLTTRAMQYIMQDLREKAKLSGHVTPHSLRHHFASRIAETTGNLRMCQKLLGHVRLDTSQIYTHPSLDDMATAVERITQPP